MMSYGSDAPFIVFSIPEVEREERVQLSEDFCIVDDQYFYIRGNILIRVVDSLDVFSWNVWVSMSAENFYLVTKGEQNLQTLFGYLATSIPLYPETVGLKVKVYTQSVGLRPFIEIKPTNHPLAIEQMEGITLERIHQFANELLHP